MKKIKNSLLSRYILIILIAVIIIPFSFPIVTILFYMPLGGLDGEENIYHSGIDIEKMWYKEAEKLEGASAKEIKESLNTLKKTYQKASIFWVDESGKTQYKQPANINVPEKWSSSYTVDFMKKNRGETTKIFTVVALIGKKQNNGFMVIQVPRSEMVSKQETIRDRYDFFMMLATLLILAVFIFISWVFFYRIRKRLVRIQEAMSSPTESGIPAPLEIERQDEIGQLEDSFNRMIEQLETSRLREREEEELRRQLIANLSHDIRTPLTTIRGHAYSLQSEELSEKGQQSLQLIDNKIGYLGQLIENLLSYTLLSSGKYPYQPKEIDINRVIRTSLAAWYPVFEEGGFEIDLELSETPVIWTIDTQWMERILDNIFQNVNRHAKSGKFIGVRVDASSLIIEDQGPGMTGQSTQKGVGIGLSIISLMVKEMGLDWEVQSDGNGTKMIIRRLP